MIERPVALATHTLSLPSMAMPQGPLILLPAIKRRQDRAIGTHHGNVATGILFENVQTGRSTILAAASAFDAGSTRLSTFDWSLLSTNASFSFVSGRPTVLATQTLPRLSMATARGAKPTLICSALPGSLAGKRVTVLEPLLVTQIRSC